jgi:hypothetical protein
MPNGARTSAPSRCAAVAVPPRHAIRLDEGMRFTTYGTLRSDAREKVVSRDRQIVYWLGRDFDGVIVFDESHAMPNAAGAKGEAGRATALATPPGGLRLRHVPPDARVLYVSTTGATTFHDLAYIGFVCGAARIFRSPLAQVRRSDRSVIAAMEVLARDLKALDLYAAAHRHPKGSNMSWPNTCALPNRFPYMAPMRAPFQVVHNRLDAALDAANVTGESAMLNAQAKSAARRPAA